VCKELLQEFRIPPDMYQIGRTKLFFRAGVLGHLEDTSARINRCARSVYTRPPLEAVRSRLQLLLSGASRCTDAVACHG
jgi:myosin heavy subunit